MTGKYYLKMRILRTFAKKNGLKVLIGIIALLGLLNGLYVIGTWGVNLTKYCYHAYILDDLYSSYSYSIRINNNLVFYENGSHGYIEDTKTQSKILRDVYWIAGVDNEKDTMICFAQNGYRGFLHRNTGKVVIPANRYKKAWLYSEGFAAVMERDSTLKFINTAGQVVIDNNFKYAQIPPTRGFIFKNGHCPMKGSNDLWGLIDKEGKWIVLPEYDDIESTDYKCWIVYKDKKQGLINDNLHLVLRPTYLDVRVTEKGIEVITEEYYHQLYDYNGTLIEPCIYTDIKELYYKSSIVDPNFDEYDYTLSPYLEYHTTYSSKTPTRVGLMSPDGTPVTPPLYISIQAVNESCFRCFFEKSGCDNEGSSVLINTKGQVIN